ncbi:hypothetical protein DFP73DRAFT_601244 [Morchella snyderi]|nr:hypothetical protein DFP73DRAFT_601244 [Morchella snyderi]
MRPRKQETETRKSQDGTRLESVPTNLTSLEPDTFGYFSPIKIPDAEAPYRFIDAIQDGVTVYGDLSTRAVLRRCIKGTIANNWYFGLAQEEKELLTISTTHWVELLRRDFMPRVAILEIDIQKEKFSYSQGRSASEYVNRKIPLCKIAEITNENLQVEMIHKMLSEATELFAMMEMEVKDEGTDRVQDYKARVCKLQDTAHTSFTTRRDTPSSYRKKPWVKYSYYTPKNTTTTALSDKGIEKEKNTTSNKDAKKYPRSRKCKNFPSCGDGEHWDPECKLCNSNLPSTQMRTYYVDANATSDTYEERNEDSDAEEYYGNIMQAHFAHQYKKTWTSKKDSQGWTAHLSLSQASPYLFPNSNKIPPCITITTGECLTSRDCFCNGATIGPLQKYLFHQLSYRP